MHDPLQWLERELEQLEANHLRRHLTIRGGRQRSRITVDGQTIVNFGSNDYLALATDMRVAQAAISSIQAVGWGSGASPLVTGRGIGHAELERHLAAWKHAEAAIIFSSGFAANVGTIAALADRGDRIYSDAKNHASIIDGCRLSRADVSIYRHADAADLARQLKESGTAARRRFIVTESVFSMDGDIAPLGEVLELAEQTGSTLIVDEAHATGVMGEEGGGVCSQLGISDRVSVRIGTLSKALGSAGGYVVGSQTLIDWLLNRARSYVFSTAPPESACMAALVALRIARGAAAQRKKLLEDATWLRRELALRGWNTGESASQIVPVFVGSAPRALELSARLRQAGMLVPAIRPPTVPPGESLLRISLTTAHRRQDLNRLLEHLGQAAESVPAIPRPVADRPDVD